MIRFEHIFLLIVLLFTLFSCKPKGPEAIACDELRSGKYRMIDQTKNITYEIERINNVQIEVNQSTLDTARYSVSWGSDCYYVLNLIEGPDWMLPLWDKNELTVKITEITPTDFTYRAKFSNSETILTNTMERL